MVGEEEALVSGAAGDMEEKFEPSGEMAKAREGLLVTRPTGGEYGAGGGEKNEKCAASVPEMRADEATRPETG